MKRKPLRPVIAAGAATIVLLAGCTSPEDANYIEVTVGKLTIDRPAAWATEVPTEEPWTAGWAVAADSIEQIRLSGDFGDYTSAAEGAATLTAQAQVTFEGFEIVESRDVELRGATTGRLVRFTIDDPQGNDVVGTWIVGAVWPYPQSAAVATLTPTHDPDLERRLLESFEISADTGR